MHIHQSIYLFLLIFIDHWPWFTVNHSEWFIRMNHVIMITSWCHHESWFTTWISPWNFHVMITILSRDHQWWSRDKFFFKISAFFQFLYFFYYIPYPVSLMSNANTSSYMRIRNGENCFVVLNEHFLVLTLVLGFSVLNHTVFF